MSEKHFSAIEIGTPVIVSFPNYNDTSINLVVNTIGKYIEPVNRTFSITANLNNNTVFLPNMLVELTMTHPTVAAHEVVKMITKGRYAMTFYLGAVLLGNIIPLVLLLMGGSQLMIALSGVMVLAGIYFTEKIWVEAPQRISLS